jgi:hypothetical protein
MTLILNFLLGLHMAFSVVMDEVIMVFVRKSFSRNSIKLTVSAIVLLATFFVLPQESLPEFYKYVDQNGTIHFVDSKAKIPKKYRDHLTVYEEKYDHLSEEEREKKIEDDRRQAEEHRKNREAYLEVLRRRERIAQERLLEKQEEEALAEERREEQIARKKYLMSLETKVEIVGYGQALVPCTMVYKDHEVEAKLLLDTGCSITVIHDDVAKELNLKPKTRGKAQTAGGNIIGVRYGNLSYIRVGPHKIDDLCVGVIKHKGRKPQMRGLLGMNFLAGLDYKIDYASQLIRWAPSWAGIHP